MTGNDPCNDILNKVEKVWIASCLFLYLLFFFFFVAGKLAQQLRDEEVTIGVDYGF